MFLERDVIASYLSVLIRLKLNVTDYYRRSSESQRLKQLRLGFLLLCILQSANKAQF